MVFPREVFQPPLFTMTRNLASPAVAAQGQSV